MSKDDGDALTHDIAATMARVAEAMRFMEREAPRMAVAAGLLPNEHRRVDCETVEEGNGELAHRILVSEQLRASFVVFPGTLSGACAADFLVFVGPEKERLVIAAVGYIDDARRRLAEHWPGTLTLLTFAGTEREPHYKVHTEPAA